MTRELPHSARSAVANAKRPRLWLGGDRIVVVHREPIALDIAALQERFPSVLKLETRAVRKRANSRLSSMRGDHKKRYRRLKKLGLCVFCGRNRTQGYVLCESCRASVNAKVGSRYHGKRVVDACTDCRGEPAAGKSRCAECATRRAALPSRQWGYRKKREYRYRKKRPP